MVTSPVRRLGAIALLAALVIAVPVAIAPAEEVVAPPPATELFGSVEPGETAVDADWVRAEADAFVEEQRAEGASVTSAPCIIGDRPTIEVPGLRPYLRQPVGTSGRFVVTPSGNVHFVCHASVPARTRLPANAVVVDGTPCFLPNRRRTNDSHIVLTPSGQITLTCHFTP
jgi:hypothetical protein